MIEGMVRLWWIPGAAWLFACGGGGASADSGPDITDPPPGWSMGVPLPEPMTGNGVASLELDGGCLLLSAFGIDAALEPNERAYLHVEGSGVWHPLPLPGGAGTVRTSAAAAAGLVLLATSYPEDVAGRRRPYFVAYDLKRGGWASVHPSIAVLEPVALAWRDFILLIGGRVDDVNVPHVQMYNIETRSWMPGTPFPGVWVHGHAGAIAGDTIIILDGVAEGPVPTLVNQVWRGDLDPSEPGVIEWTDLGEHPGPPRFGAAGGGRADGRFWFHGGSASVHDLAGTSVETGEPAVPIASTLVIDIARNEVREVADEKPEATMDNRTLAPCGQSRYLIGGMTSSGSATATVWRYTDASP